MEANSTGQLVYTLAARCRDCYRCLRACPVKAIRMRDGQAYVDETRCIACGTCIRECPQKAKTFRSDVDVIQKMVENGARIAASVAPSFAAVFAEWQKKRLVAALRRLGVSYVGETSAGAWHVACATRELLGTTPSAPYISTACPAVVNLVEKYYPQYASRLIPLVSPMRAHVMHLREKLGPDWKIVFIGPCVAKKSELLYKGPGLPDAVITFKELSQWLESRHISLSQCEESGFDEEACGRARVFPLPGGMAMTAGIDAGLIDTDILHVTGEKNVRDVLDNADKTDGMLIEALFCTEGCINGPAVDCHSNVYERRTELLKYSRHCPSVEPPQPLPAASLAATYPAARPVHVTSFTDEQINAVLSQTGKSLPEQQLNCGACGYASCREKAVAVLEGMAVPEMCMPYMRRLAEQRTDRIIETSPNGIVILDHALNILAMNPSFKKLFNCSDGTLGRSVSCLMDPEPFEKLMAGTELVTDIIVTHDKYGIICHEMLYELKEERQLVGVFINVSGDQDSQRKLEAVKAQTVLQAQELLSQQISMAQKIAQFLGENTARVEELVNKIIDTEDGNKS
jgi:iron only hydrogenase large subunit-like protein/uncharacterized Fe-S cluster-containing protein